MMTQIGDLRHFIRHAWDNQALRRAWDAHHCMVIPLGVVRGAAAYDLNTLLYRWLTVRVMHQTHDWGYMAGLDWDLWQSRVGHTKCGG